MMYVHVGTLLLIKLGLFCSLFIPFYTHTNMNSTFDQTDQEGFALICMLRVK